MEGKLRGREKESFVLSLVWLVAFFFLFCFFSPPDLGGDWSSVRLLLVPRWLDNNRRVQEDFTSMVRVQYLEE